MNIQDVSQFLSHPLFLLIVGAVITSVLVPKLTQVWQDQRKKLEIKLQIANQIGETVTLGMAHAIAITRGIDNHEEEANCVLKSKTVEVQLFTYFSSMVADDWQKYVNMLTGFWSLTRDMHNKQFSETKTFADLYKSDIIKEKFSNKIEWEKLGTKDSEIAWEQIRGFLIGHYKKYVILVKESTITLF